MADQERAWVVHKFGGSSLSQADRINIVAGLSATFSKSYTNPRNAIVVSAFGGVTNSLVETVELAKKRDDQYIASLEAVIQRHVKTAIELFQKSAERVMGIMNQLNKDKDDLLALLRAVYLSKHVEDTLDSIIKGIGEIWSSLIVTEYLASLNPNLVVLKLDAREFIITSGDVSGPKICWDRSQQIIDKWIQEVANPSKVDILVVPGFVATTVEGLPTTLKRNSSDFSAAIVTALLRAQECTIWTDVDGVYSANPKLVKNPVLLETLSYQEAIELSYFGAKVLHPLAIQPCMQLGIPIFIRNTFNIPCPGTKIFNNADGDKQVKGFSTIEGIAILNIEGTGLAGLPEIPHRLFGCLKDVSCNTLLVTKGSSEHSICLGIHEVDVENAVAALNKTFYLELQTKAMDPVEVIRGCTVMAVVGDGIIGTPGIAGRIFTAFGESGANIIAIAQGSSERNISVVFQSQITETISKFIHNVLYPPCKHFPSTYFALVGPGLIGSTLLSHLSKFNANVEFREDSVEVIAIAASKKMILHDGEWSRSLNLKTWKTDLQDSAVATDIDKIVEFLLRCRKETGRPVAIVDCTACDIFTDRLPSLLSQGINFVTANKKPITGDYKIYQEVQHLIKKNRRVQCLFEACVGAGLPVIATLGDMVNVGDHVHKTEGIFSGTLSFIFNEWGKKSGVKFSDIVLKAKALGYTEPDPRDDLSGEDFARKLVVLCRRMGLNTSLSDINIQSLVPKELKSVSVNEFLARLPDYDEEMSKIRDAALEQGKILSYVGSITSPPNEKAQTSLGLVSLDTTHPFAGLSGSDNIISFITDMYTLPLVIRGAGAGANVTASGIFSDLLKLKF